MSQTDISGWRRASARQHRGPCPGRPVLIRSRRGHVLRVRKGPKRAGGAGHPDGGHRDRRRPHAAARCSRRGGRFRVRRLTRLLQQRTARPPAVRARSTRRATFAHAVGRAASGRRVHGLAESSRGFSRGVMSACVRCKRDAVNGPAPHVGLAARGRHDQRRPSEVDVLIQTSPPGTL
jgi:hypothetical protein